jgi:type IV pilus assembly protein PilY1
MYAADMGGQIFRFDIYNGESVSSLVEGGLIAQLGGDGLSDNRRFYYGPDISEVSSGGEHYFALAIGSGYRAGPLNTDVKDAFFMIKDKDIFLRDGFGKFTLPDEVFTKAALYDASDHLLSAGSTEEKEIQNKLLMSKQGWMIRFQQAGEKVLSSALIVDKRVFFTTHLPPQKGVSDCRLSAGSNRAYLVNLTNGNAVVDLSKNGEKDAGDRYALMRQTGIAPAAQVLFENVTKPLLCLGTECASAVIDTGLTAETVPCASDFECLARNIYGSFNRVHKSTWQTEVELQ